MTSQKNIQQQLTLSDELVGMRLDQALATLLTDCSRTQIQEWIKNGEITVNGLKAKTKTTVLGGESVIVNAFLKAQPEHTPCAMDLDIVYEDEAILVLNKPAGLVVHPAAGHYSDTLLNALIHHAPALQQLPRAGIVHRLDKDTSGLLVIAKTHEAHLSLSTQLKSKNVTRIYQAIVAGVLISGGTIEAAMERHPRHRKKMAVMDTGKPAVTHYRIMDRYRAHTRIKVQLETGRTHQIRVHMAHIHHAVLGDQTYGGRLQLPKGATPPLVEMLRSFKRQALHAYELGFIHPVTREPVTFTAPLPQDMEELISVLKTDASQMGTV